MPHALTLPDQFLDPTGGRLKDAAMVSGAQPGRVNDLARFNLFELLLTQPRAKVIVLPIHCQVQEAS